MDTRRGHMSPPTLIGLPPGPGKTTMTTADRLAATLVQHLQHTCNTPSTHLQNNRNTPATHLQQATPSFGSEQRRYGASSFSASSSSEPHRPSSAQHGYSKFGSHGFNSRFGANSGGASSSKSYYAAAGSDDDDDFHF